MLTPFYCGFGYGVDDPELFLDQRILKGLIVTLHLIFDCKSIKKSTALLFLFASTLRNSSQPDRLHLAWFARQIVRMPGAAFFYDFLNESQEQQVS